MADGLIIKVGADVGDAIAGLSKLEQQVVAFGGGVQKSLNITEESLKKFASSFGKTAQGFGRIPGAANQASFAITNLNRVVQDAPFGFVGIQNNIGPLIDSFSMLKNTTGTTKGALTALLGSLSGPAGIGLAVAAVTTAVTFASNGFGAWTRGFRAAKEESDKLAQSVAAELVDLTTLVGIVQNSATTTENRQKALKALNEEYGKYLPNLKEEGITVNNITSAYQLLTDELLKQAVVKGIQQEIQKEVEKTASKIIRVQKAQEELRLENQKSIDTNLKKISSDQVIQRGLDGLNKTQNDGYLATQKNTLAAKTAVGTFDAFGAIIRNLKSELNKSLEPLLKLTTNFDDLGKSVKDAKAEPLDFGLKNAFGELTLLEGKLASAFELATFYTEKFKKDIKAAFKPLKEEKIEFRINLSQKAKDAKTYQEEMNAVGDALQSALTQAISQGAVAGLSALGEGIGNLMSGKGFGNQLFEVLGSMLQQIGKALLEFALVKKIVDKITNNPLTVSAGVALGAGILAIAAGTMIKNFGGAREFGGPVSGNKTYLVGEKGPELFVPSVSGTIIPNNQVGSMGGRAISGGGGNGRTIIRGNDIILSYARASRSQSRVNG